MHTSIRLAPALLCVAACGSGDDDPPAPTVVPVTVNVDASTVTTTLQPLWGDHYDLSFASLAYTSDATLMGLIADLAPRSVRCSIGRWEVGLAPPTGGDSLVPAELQAVDREFYTGANTLAAADDPANYDFTYLDGLLADIASTGAEPYLCFDYMPFTLSSEQDPNNPFNFNVTQPGTPYSSFSFSNGIRTAPPADPAVYARVVRNSIRHVRGLFAGTTDFGVEYFEVGNEPDLIDPMQVPVPYFWTGTVGEWSTMYAAIAAEVDADAQLTNTVKIGGGSFAAPATEIPPTFYDIALGALSGANARMDFVSYHSYSDDPDDHFVALSRLNGVLVTLGINAEIVNGEWGRQLGGVDPVYDTIEHGIFRARTIALMQLFGVRFAHEALLRDPIPLVGGLGLLATGPAAHKPVSHCYRALGLLDGSLDALAVTATDGVVALAGRDAGGTRVVVVLIADRPAAGTETEAAVRIESLPWGNAAFEVRRYWVNEATVAAGPGLDLVSTTNGSGGALTTTARWAVGGEGLVVFELNRL